MLALLGDSVTTDHISPAGNIKADSLPGATCVKRAWNRAISTHTVRGAATMKS